MNFLFDVINEISGYTEKYYNESQELLNHEGLIAKYRKEKEKYDKSNKNINESELLGDMYPHSLLVLESAHELLRMPGSKVALKVDKTEFGSPLTPTKSLAQDYLDALLLRVIPGTDNWYRNHFPVVLETNMSHYFNE